MSPRPKLNGEIMKDVCSIEPDKIHFVDYRFFNIIKEELL